MSTFAITKKYAGHIVKVEGLDDQGNIRSTKLDSTEWDEMQRLESVKVAEAAVDNAIEAFYAPLIEAIDDAEESIKVAEDPAFFVVEQEEERGVLAKHEVRRYLNKDTIILRMIESGDTSRLDWDGDAIEILAV